MGDYIDGIKADIQMSKSASTRFPFGLALSSLQHISKSRPLLSTTSTPIQFTLSSWALKATHTNTPS
jgi:hypothetical protein